MPELPEVEIMTRQLRRWLAGRRISSVEVRDPKIQLNGHLTGRRIRGIRRRAKFIIFDLTGDRHLLVHLRMTGWFEFVEPPRYRLALRAGKVGAYFTDSRRFGVVELLTPTELHARLAGLGPEPFAGTLERLRQTRRAIKVALLDQSLVAGVGNIYASEALWRARIHPRRAAHRLTDRDLERLQQRLVAALRKGIAYGPRIFAVQKFYAYARTGQPCARCRTPIRQIVQAQRSTFFCPHCQR
jgi:formamidopyrimidine-DNA glycosylase